MDKPKELSSFATLNLTTAGSLLAQVLLNAAVAAAQAAGGMAVLATWLWASAGTKHPKVLRNNVPVHV